MNTNAATSTEIFKAAQDAVSLQTSGKTAVEIRKIAAGYGIKGASKGRKNDLVKAMIEIEVERITKQEEIKAAAKAKATKKAPAKKTLCVVCGTRKIDTRTQGRDSDMCQPCFDYAGWENTHTDNGHESLPANHIERLECPVCQEADPSFVKIAHPKAAQFANAARAAGWTVEVEDQSKTAGAVRKATFTVTAKGEGESISLSWEAGLYDYDASDYVDEKGSRKVRNTSAAIQILQAKAVEAK